MAFRVKHTLNFKKALNATHLEKQEYKKRLYLERREAKSTKCFLNVVWACVRVVMNDQLNDPLIEEGDSNDQTQLAQLCVSLWGKASGPTLTAQRHS